ncbi:MAG: cobalamin biosynthesis protein [Candidatus Bathyarchaeia archaeon]
MEFSLSIHGLQSFIILFLALLIDIIFGEPPEKLHPTVWIGKTIKFLENRLKHKNPLIEKIYGAFLAIFVVSIFSITSHFLLKFLVYLSPIAYIVISAMLLKTTFAIKSMKLHSIPIANELSLKNLTNAKKLLKKIVRRNVNELNEELVVSATVESIAEGTVDGITSSLFYFAIFGVSGSIAYRAINTLDSMVGYKDIKHLNIGWFSAKLDTIANYIPARITALLMILAAWFIKEDWKKALLILKRDRNKTESLNAGWPMSAMAGILNVKLEKLGHYKLGNSNSTLNWECINKALKIMGITIILFLFFIVIPIMILFSLH